MVAIAILVFSYCAILAHFMRATLDLPRAHQIFDFLLIKTVMNLPQFFEIIIAEAAILNVDPCAICRLRCVLHRIDNISSTFGENLWNSEEMATKFLKIQDGSSLLEFW
jgi:hypothetical protein